AQAQLKGDLSEATFVKEIRQNFQDFENAKKTMKKLINKLEELPEDGGSHIQLEIETMVESRQLLLEKFEELEDFKSEMYSLLKISPKELPYLKKEFDAAIKEFKESPQDELAIIVNSMRVYKQWLIGMLQFSQSKEEFVPGLKLVSPKPSASSKTSSPKANTGTKTDEPGLTVDQFEKRGKQITFVKLMASELYGTEENPKLPSVPTVINVLSMLALLRAEASKRYDAFALEYRNTIFHPQGSKSDRASHYQDILLPIIDSNLSLDSQHDFHTKAKTLLRVLCDTSYPNPKWKVVDQSLKDLRDMSRDVFKLQRFKKGDERTQKLQDMFRHIGGSYYKMSQKADSGSPREKLESYIQNFIGPDQLLSLQYANILLNLDGGIDKEDWIEPVTQFLRNGTAHGREMEADTLRILTILVENAHSEMRDKELSQTKSAERSDILKEGVANQPPLSPEELSLVSSGQAGSK
ncbi:hypothetical protein DID77_03860, partial [Candidatus Marinamargulisbacteria bacterium SCGC AG-439-L15]